MDAIKLSYCSKFVVKQLEENEDSQKKKKSVIIRKGKMLKTNNNKSRMHQLMKFWKKESESVIFKKVEKINQMSYTQKKLSL